MSIALATTWENRLHDFGNIPASRVRTNPAPGTVTVEDVTRLRNTERRLYDLVDGTLVEKSTGWQESLLAGILLHWLHSYLDAHRLGVATGADGMTRLLGDTVRGPDVAFVAWDRMPHGQIPTDPIPDLVPNFVIELAPLRCFARHWMQRSIRKTKSLTVVTSYLAGKSISQNYSADSKGKRGRRRWWNRSWFKSAHVIPGVLTRIKRSHTSR